MTQDNNIDLDFFQIDEQEEQILLDVGDVEIRLDQDVAENMQQELDLCIDRLDNLDPEDVEADHSSTASMDDVDGEDEPSGFGTTTIEDAGKIDARKLRHMEFENQSPEGF